MLSVQMEERVNLKFLVKLGKTFIEAYAMLKEVLEEMLIPHNGLNGLKRDVKRPKTIHAPDVPQRQYRTQTLKKLIQNGGSRVAEENANHYLIDRELTPSNKVSSVLR
ncbi:hypothetical protein NQ318_018920 [Aromia moschata]|uniref:Uncharacterized protein n=1 Tax=Aromia moschata TaxID=1265417 RepID=A0AAV8ZGH2_9CUCU|nr:hypothetical protein NQ318_018920 [Aromia moschata]